MAGIDTILNVIFVTCIVGMLVFMKSMDLEMPCGCFPGGSFVRCQAGTGPGSTDCQRIKETADVVAQKMKKIGKDTEAAFAKVKVAFSDLNIPHIPHPPKVRHLMDQIPRVELKPPKLDDIPEFSCSLASLENIIRQVDSLGESAKQAVVDPWVRKFAKLEKVGKDFEQIAQKIRFKDSYGRGAGKVPTECNPGEDKDGALCYPPCNPGFHGAGPVCWANCDGRHDTGFQCEKRSYGRGAGTAMIGTCPGGWSPRGVSCVRQGCPGGYDANMDGGVIKTCCRWNGCAWRTNPCGWFGGNCEVCVGAPECTNPFESTMAITYRCPDGKQEDAGLCYDHCAPGYKGVGPVCWEESCPPNTTDNGAVCTKHSYGRGAGTPLVCKPGAQGDAGLCYDECPPGYKGVGPMCHKDCPPDYIDLGIVCIAKS